MCLLLAGFMHKLQTPQIYTPFALGLSFIRKVKKTVICCICTHVSLFSIDPFLSFLCDEQTPSKQMNYKTFTYIFLVL